MAVEAFADGASADATVARMLGEPGTFFRDHWRRTPFLAHGACLDWAGRYGIEQYLADLAETQDPPYRAVTARDGRRIFSQHATAQALRAAVGAGAVSSMKISRAWHVEHPRSWDWMRDLFGGLCRAAAMTYLNPDASEDVDLFLAGPDSGLGAHIDATDVFTLQLVGERCWEIDEAVQMRAVLDRTRDCGWHPSREMPFQAPTRMVTLRPGDALYVPAYAVHRVSGVSWSVSLSLGLRAFNEIDVVEHLLDRIKDGRYMDLAPLESWPGTESERQIAAKLALVRRVRDLLTQIESAAMTTALAPLHLPPTLVGRSGG